MKRRMTDIINEFFTKHAHGCIEVCLNWELNFDREECYRAYSLNQYMELMENLDASDGFLGEKFTYSVYFVDRGVTCMPRDFKPVTCTPYEHLRML